MKKVNIIDIIILVLVVAAIAAVVLLKAGGGLETEQTFKTVTLELAEKYEGFSENVIVGDTVTEKVKKVKIGTVTGVDAKPSEKNSYDRKTGKPTVVNVPEREDVYVTMKIDSAAEVYVGKQLSVITKHFTGSGFVVAVADEN